MLTVSDLSVSYGETLILRNVGLEVRAGVANYQTYFGEAVVSGPINDHLKFRLGANYTVQLTNRYPTSNDFFVAYWKPATDGFDIFLAEPHLVGVGINPDQKVPYYVDWIVVQK